MSKNNLEITYFHRHKSSGISIFKVSNTLTTEIAKTTKTKEFFLPQQRVTLINIIKNIWFVFNNRDPKGINHITGDCHYVIIGLIGCKSVLTIHDLNMFEYAANPLKRFIFKWLWFKIPLVFASSVVCISQETKSKVKKLTARKDIRVIYNAIDPTFLLNYKTFNTNMPNILQIGTGWNKNLLNVIEALSQIQCHLTIIGNVDNLMLTHLAKFNISYTNKESISDAALLDEYYKSDIVIFCSKYEGFGMPIIEGNAVGRCVITSSIAPLNEIAGNAACFVEPTSVVAIRKGVNKLIFNSDFRDELIRNGILNVKRFDVSNIASSYIDLYLRLLNRKY